MPISDPLIQSLKARRHLAWHIGVALICMAVLSQGLGYRALWVDEAETAERGRLILERGYPTLLDSQGTPSLSAAGMELEESDTHRYSPWIPFYWEALGLGLGRLLGWEQDFSARIPFVSARAITAGAISFGLAELAAIPRPLSALVALSWAGQSLGIVHARTARYHALLDMLALAGLLGLGLRRVGSARGRLLLPGAIFLLPQVHTFGGSLVSISMGALAAVRLLSGPYSIRKLWRALATIVMPGLLSLCLLLTLLRPWANMIDFGPLKGETYGSLSYICGITYALVFFALAGFWLIRSRQHRASSLAIFASLVTIIFFVSILDRHDLSQSRYYLSVATLALFWPVALGLPGPAPARLAFGIVLLAVTALPELALSNLQGGDWPRFPSFRPYQGLRLIASDAALQSNGERQPFHEALDIIRRESSPADPVQIDYVPQLVNWYLPGHPIGLVPDSSQRNRRNRSHPIWKHPIELPAWHIWYPKATRGFILCGGGVCDYRVSNYEPGRKRYIVESGRLGRKIRMCIVKQWATHHWNNSPFRNLLESSALPGGSPDGLMILSRACPRQGAELSADGQKFRRSRSTMHGRRTDWLARWLRYSPRTPIATS